MKSSKLLSRKSKHLLEQLNKYAGSVSATGRGAETPFEHALATLGHAILKDKNPELLDHEIGFQVIDKNDDNTKALGVFGFKIGKRLLYVPIVFIDGNIHGHNILIHLASSPLWTTNSSEWLAAVAGRQQYKIGKPVSRNLSSQGVRTADYNSLLLSPAKRAAAESDWIGSATGLIGEAVGFVPSFTAIDIPSFLKKAGSAAAQGFQSLMSEYPSLLRSLDMLYRKEEIDEALKQAAATPSVRPAAPAIQKTAAEESPNWSSKVTIIRMSAISPIDRSILTDSDREKLLRNGHLVVDRRSDDEVATAFDDVAPKNLKTPGEAGIYEVLTTPTDFSECAIFPAPYTHKKRNKGCLVVRLSDKAWLYTDASKVFTRNQKPQKEFMSWIESLPEVQASSGAQILVGPTGQHVSCPSYTLKRRGSDVWDTYFHSKPAVDGPVSRRYPDADATDELSCYLTRDNGKIVRTGARGIYFRATGDALYVPKGTKSLRLHDGYCGCGTDSEPPPILELSNLVDMHLGIIKAAQLKKLKVRKRKKGFSINEKEASDRAEAVESLVCDYGLRESIAETLLKRSESEEMTEVHVYDPRVYANKQADAPVHELQRSAPNAPTITEPSTGLSDWSGGLVEESPKYRLTSVADDVYGGSQSDPEAHRIYPVSQSYMIGGDSDREAPDEKESLRIAAQAAESGHKEIFDAHIITSVAKRSRIESILNEVLPAITDCMNEQGKALLNLYYNRDAWSDRFGKSEVPDLEDQLESSHESLSKLVLQLKEGTAQAAPTESSLPDVNSF